MDKITAIRDCEGKLFQFDNEVLLKIKDHQIDDLTVDTPDIPIGGIIQYVGQTTDQYTTGYFYKKVLKSEANEFQEWIQIDVQPASTTSDSDEGGGEVTDLTKTVEQILQSKKVTIGTNTESQSNVDINSRFINLNANLPGSSGVTIDTANSSYGATIKDNDNSITVNSNGIKLNAGTDISMEAETTIKIDGSNAVTVESDNLEFIFDKLRIEDKDSLDVLYMDGNTLSFSEGLDLTVANHYNIKSDETLDLTTKGISIKSEELIYCTQANVYTPLYPPLRIIPWVNDLNYVHITETVDEVDISTIAGIINMCKSYDDFDEGVKHTIFTSNDYKHTYYIENENLVYSLAFPVFETIDAAHYYYHQQDDTKVSTSQINYSPFLFYVLQVGNHPYCKLYVRDGRSVLAVNGKPQKSYDLIQLLQKLDTL